MKVPGMRVPNLGASIDSGQMRSVAPLFIPDLANTHAVFQLVVIAELLAIAVVLAARPLAQFDWPHLGLTSLFVQWVSLTSAAILCRMRGWLGRQSVGIATLVSLLVILCDTAAMTVLAHGVSQGGLLGSEGLDTHLLIRNLLIATIIGGLVLHYFYVQSQLSGRYKSELQARLQALQSKIRPHFLFNSMNIIASLIPTRPDVAEEVVEDLCDLFRASLGDVGSEVPIVEELRLCRRYVHIEKLRLGDRLQVEWALEDFPAQVMMPLLTLQPLLENAIYHGIQPRPQGGTVAISGRILNGSVVFTVSNPVDPSAESSHTRGNRMALDNIRHRLQVLYGEQARVTASVAQSIYTIELSYPFVERGVGEA